MAPTFKNYTVDITLELHVIKLFDACRVAKILNNNKQQET